MLSHKYGDLFNDYYRNKFRQYGSTHFILNDLGHPESVHSIDPAIVHAMLVSSSDDWTVFKLRRNTLKPLAQGGLLTTAGALWHYNRKLLHRHINSSHAKDIRDCDSDVDLLFQAIGSVDEYGWTAEANLTDLLHRLAYDMSTQYLFGVKADFQLSSTLARRKGAELPPASTTEDTEISEANAILEAYLEAFEVARGYVTARGALIAKYWMVEGLAYRRACKKFEMMADLIVAKFAYEKSEDKINSEHAIIDKLLVESKDPIKVRDNVLELTFAGQNMTGSAMEWVIAELSSHPEVYKELRQELVGLFGAEKCAPRVEMTWNSLKACQTLQNVIAETLRCHPLVATLARTALRDRVISRGGGPSGEEPIAMPQGASVTANIYLLHHRTEEWGDDAWEWKPDRWIGRKVGHEYFPFGAGPRVCIRRQLSLTEISFVLARFVQRYEEILHTSRVDRLANSCRATLSPKEAVRVRLKRASS